MQLTLKDFLKKFTAIPAKFIDEYYVFYEKCDNNKFGIPIEDVMTYLKITNLKKFQERIRDNYTLHIDYEIIRIRQKSTQGVKDANYMISFECFEKIAMNSTTKKGAEFRDYFVMLRKFIDYYKDHISSKLLELTQTNKFIYILLVNKDKNIFKLGRTKDMRKRLQTYATGKDTHPDIKFIMIVDDEKTVEKCTKLFAKPLQYKANKELYQTELDTLKKLVFDCAYTKKELEEHLNSDNAKKYDTYVVFDDSKRLEYLNLSGDVIGLETPKKTINNSKSKFRKFRKTKKISTK